MFYDYQQFENCDGFCSDHIWYLWLVFLADRILLNKIKVESSEEIQELEGEEEFENQKSHSVTTVVPPHFIQIKAGSEEVRCLYCRSMFNRISYRYNFG